MILNVAPAYVTDAIVRKTNIDRYNDREIIKTNLVESYGRLMDFGKKHLPDKFFLENDMNKSLRNSILREMISNVLMHREFSSSYTAKFVIEKDKMYVENADSSAGEECITEDNLEPNSKNSLIASFFGNMGYVDKLGSGVRNLFKYSKYYSGQEPEFMEGDIFRIIVPLDDAYSYDFAQTAGGTKDADKVPINNADKLVEDSLSEQQKQVLQYVKENGKITSHVGCAKKQEDAPDIIVLSNRCGFNND